MSQFSADVNIFLKACFFMSKNKRIKNKFVEFT